MNKHLFKLGGTIIGLEALFYIIFYFGQIIKSFSPSTSAIWLLCGMAVGVGLLFASGIGAFMAKKWSVITLWISLAIGLIISLSLGYYVPSYFGNFQAWFTDLIIAIYFTIEIRKNK